MRESQDKENQHLFCLTCAKSGLYGEASTCLCFLLQVHSCSLLPKFTRATVAFFQFLGCTVFRCPLPGKYFPPSSPNSSSSSFRSLLTHGFLQKGCPDFSVQVSISVMDSPRPMWLCFEAQVTVVILHLFLWLFSLTRCYAPWQQGSWHFNPCIELMNEWLSLILRKTCAIDILNSIFKKYKEAPVLG